MERTVSAGVVARALGVRPVTVRRWAAEGRIPATRTAGGHRRFSLDEVLASVRPTGDPAGDAVATVRRAVAAWRVPPLHASVFGSVARGSARDTSDLDLLVVVPSFGSDADRRTYGAQMVDLHFVVDRELHRDLREVELDVPRLERAVQSSSLLLLDVLREGQLVWGPPLRQLLQPIVARLPAATRPGAA